ncbi:MAG TPA: hypothetical protein DDW17_05965, partial [Deltaproteobacteria bacterium]|nr:hypothetical protein [Deltaproteobacteria bacterium]
IITGKMIEIKGCLARHKIVKKVVNTFIKIEYCKKGKGVIFKYPVENLPDGYLFIARPGHKKNFDFKVEVPVELGLGEGSHIEIARDLRKKEQENQERFEELLNAISNIYNCSENDVNKILMTYPHLNESFKTGAKVEIILKVVKWLFIMEDIVYWDNEGRAFLFNFLKYVAKESNENRLNEALDKVKNPDRLKSFMKKCGIEWL